ncbi:Pimeloyl-ACP methyl ester carboxylesterase [Cnuella takakiae]|uniref:Pimeloyl-ACP methyl ester carboxylesterase n=1 Tax=Cnuella takakiae TaxID=1302690 RepID=A0A1M5BBZ4_9BACT|nr:alpha/beta hydrolase [Cnuella takakiae]OLY93425.1 hypothetical protein BUE76_17195 [Cnuella takakiae]SHF40034.1 Pimeloyl-ACP methyl ester carboxylesterase [Cnuella takakiae]
MNGTILHLPDGRKLAYAQYGDPNGFPIIYFHGTPSSRREMEQWPHFGLDTNVLLRQRGLRIIAADRPGMGQSTFNPKGSVLSHAQDIAFLVQQLQISKCSVLAWSGGGPYALAIAYLLPQVVEQVQIFCGFTRQFDAEVVRHMKGNKTYFLTARYAPALIRPLMYAVSRRPLRKPPPRLLTDLKPVDYQYFGNPKLYSVMTDVSIKEACCQGARGPIYEAGLYFKPWGFRLQDILQPVHYWWGEEDTMVIRLHAAAVEQQIPKGKVTYLPAEGHLSIFVHHFETVLDLLQQ